MVRCNSLALLDLHHPRPICKRHKVAVVHSNNSSNKCLRNRNLSNSLSVDLVVCTAHHPVLVARNNKLVVYRLVVLALLQVHNNNNFRRIKA